MEQTFFMVKPDAVAERHVGEILSRIEKSGFKIKAMKMLQVDRELAEKHYAEHRNKPFFNELVGFITSGPSVAAILEGKSAVRRLRELVGKTNPKDAAQGTIRANFGADVGRNAVHASDSHEAAEREINLFFGKH